MNRNIYDIFQNILIGTTMLLALCGSVVTQADDSIWTRDKMLGDMGGLRSGLAKHGVSLDIHMTNV